MSATFVLTSNGITSREVLEVYEQYYQKGYRTVAIVVTADKEYKSKDRYALQTKEVLDRVGYATSFIDIDVDLPQSLEAFDVIYFIGGNPFYLLEQIRETRCDEVLRNISRQDRVISGASAGSLVMGRDLFVPYEFTPSKGPLDEGALLALGLVPINICPHYLRYQNKFENFEERLQKLEKKHKETIYRISDGEALVIKEDKVRKIGSFESEFFK